MNPQPEKLSGTSLDISAENRAHLKALFPTVFTETRNDKGELVESIDFEKLKAELGTFCDVFESRRERYGMDWPGKKEALRLIQTPSAATLKPCREESVNFDNTENLFIEGDNLEVLKLLQKSYYGKVKMIYIDPPYNTGKEFIYPDNYTESLETYLEYAGLIDGEGKKFNTNTANEGRFHTKWLNMMYPRLYLAKNLLKSEGAIFISIDDNEITNLKTLCNEVFGEECFVAQFTLLCNPKGRAQDKHFASNHEYILVYSKTLLPKGAFSIEKEAEQLQQEYTEEDDDGKFRTLELRNTHREFGKFNRKNLFYPFYVNTEDLTVSLDKDESLEKVLPIWDDGFEGCWTWGEPKAREDIAFLTARKVGEKWKIYVKDYANGSTRMLKTILSDKKYHTEKGQKAFNLLFNTKKKLFQSPKSTELISLLSKTITSDDDIVIDFFSGSATTAHALLNLNNEDEQHRKFLLVQLPEPCAEDSEAFKAGYKTIAEIGKERIRRVIKKIIDEQSGSLDLSDTSKQDLGFKVLKLDKSNFRQWQQLDPSTPPEKVEEELFKHIGHISDRATPEDLLYEILLKAGFTPTEKIETKAIAGKTVFSIAGGALLLCLEDEVTKELINAIAELEPMQFICLDGVFHGNDQLKANAVQTFAARNMEKEKHNQIIFKTV
ncbi:MAG: site-specific DNA-methyltransferase [Anaerolineaceae bacterium]